MDLPTAFRSFFISTSPYIKQLKGKFIIQDVDDDITYTVSDGAETFDGDPVKEAESFAKDGENRSVNIIGFNVDQKGEDQLKAVAEAGNGQYLKREKYGTSGSRTKTV